VFHTTATAMTMASNRTIGVSARPMRYLVASHEATDTLYRLMCLAPYLPGGMVVAIAVESATLYYIVFNRLTSFYFITQLV
jgi:hypothetical protein